MSERLILRGGQTPFRILAQGTQSPDNPPFSDLLFDANSATLRVLIKGVVVVSDVPLLSQDFFHQTWTTAQHVAVLFGKTFSSPPIAASVHDQGNSNFINSILNQTRKQLSQTLSISTFGCGVASALDRIHLWNAYQSITGTSKRIGYLVFDQPIGG